MKALLNCRRSIIGIYALGILGILGYTKGMEVSMAISTIVIGIAGANAYEKKGKTIADQ